MPKLILKMSRQQFSAIKKYLAKYKIFMDNKITFSLIAEPRTNEKEFHIKLLADLIKDFKEAIATEINGKE